MDTRIGATRDDIRARNGGAYRLFVTMRTRLLGTDSVQLTPFVKLLLSALVAAFVAWAGVVWSGVSSLNQGISEIGRKLARIEERQLVNSGRIDKHETEPWHRGAGEELSRLKERIRQNGDR